MVLRRRRLCLVIVCICVLDVRPSRSATNFNISAGRPNHTWRPTSYDSDDQSQLTSQQAAPAVQTTSRLAAPLSVRCDRHSQHSSCLTSTAPQIDFFLNAATFVSSQRPDNFSTSSRTVQVTDTAESSNSEQHPRDQDGTSQSYTEKSRLSLHQPSFRQSRIRLLAVRDDKTNPVGPCL